MMGLCGWWSCRMWMCQEEEQRLVSQAREAVISRIEQVEGAGSVRWEEKGEAANGVW